MRVLITGACGWTGEAIVAAVAAAGHEVTGIDLPGTLCSASTRHRLCALSYGTVADFRTVNAAIAAADAVVHLAVAVGVGAYASADEPFAVNVLGTYNVFEAARQQGLRTIVMLSSAAVHLPPIGRRRDAHGDWQSSPEGDHLYDLTKRLQEEIAKDFCDTHGMTAVVLRVGHIVDARAGLDPKGRPLHEVQYCRGGWTCRYDVAAACVRALSLGRLGYAAFHVIGSRSAVEHFDIERTEHELGLNWTARFDEYQ